MKSLLVQSSAKSPAIFVSDYVSGTSGTRELALWNPLLELHAMIMKYLQGGLPLPGQRDRNR